MTTASTTTILTRLPSELFADAIDHLILSVGIYKAFRLRAVNKLFNEAILHAIFDGILIDFDDPVHNRANNMTAPLMARRLLTLTTADRYGNDLLAAIRRAYRVYKEDDSTLGRSELELGNTLAHARDYSNNPTYALLCNAVARYMKPHDLLDLLNRPEAPISFNDTDDLQLSLSAAIIAGNIALVQKLLSRGVNINIEQYFFGKPTMLAAAYGRYEILQILLDNGANILGSADAVQRPPRSLDAPVGDYYSIVGSELRTACLAGHTNIVHLLLQRGVPTSGVGYETGILAATRGGHADLVGFLLEKASLYPPNQFLELIFFDASYHGNMEIMEMMLQNGVDVNAKRNCGHLYTRALHVAAIHGHDKAMRFLLERGAEHDHTENVAGSPMSIAIVNGHEQAVEALLDYGADINGTIKKRHRKQTLEIAARHGQTHMLQFLLRKGADISIVNGTHGKVTVGAVALRFAVERGYSPIVRVLAEAGVELNPSLDLDTNYVPVLRAVCYKHEHVLKVLEDMGAKRYPQWERDVAGEASYQCNISFLKFATKRTSEWFGKY